MSTNAAESILSSDSIWGSIKNIIKENINQRSYKTWFEPMQIISLTDDSLELSVPNRFFCEWIDNHYPNLMQNAIAQILGESKKIKYVVKNNDSESSPYNSDDWSQHHRGEIKMPSSIEINSPYYTPINDRYLFESFIVGDSNNFAYAASRAVADSPGKTNYNPLIIYGGTGLGKTHLVQAIGNHVKLRKPSAKVFYASSETFTSHFITAIQQNKVSEFSAFYRSCDILLIDDIQFFSNKGKTQEEFFHTFNDLHQNGKQIILTSDRPVNELVTLEERMISRFKWGLVVDIQPPEFETRLAILRHKCEESDLSIPGEILEYLAANLTDNVRELEGALTKILAQVTFTAAEPTLELARTIVSEIARPDKSILTIERIMEYTSQIFSLPVDQLRAKTRKKDIVQARQAAMYLSKQLTSYSLVTIGLHFGGRDHTTVIHALECVDDRLKDDVAYRQKIESMKRHLGYNK
ncbi:MAG: chromosomal replication initiator protein DnaA [Calditrichaceae bacterium]|nr:chromosomal replication initiator protein DnaA [Calditrichaceae bacterium]HES59899.1 chromosomal replication initiator protein DnaA [Caldithrix sp.]